MTTSAAPAALACGQQDTAWPFRQSEGMDGLCTPMIMSSLPQRHKPDEPAQLQQALPVQLASCMDLALQTRKGQVVQSQLFHILFNTCTFAVGCVVPPAIEQCVRLQRPAQ